MTSESLATHQGPNALIRERERERDIERVGERLAGSAESRKPPAPRRSRSVGRSFLAKGGKPGFFDCLFNLISFV